MQLKSVDGGSLPFEGDFSTFSEGATAYSLSPDSSRNERSGEYFERKVINGFLDKVRSGIDIPNYPQFRDINEMFLGVIKGVVKMKGGYIENDVLTILPENTTIPEVTALKKNSKEIHETIGQQFKVKVCVTGPYTLSCLFHHRDSGLVIRLQEMITKIVENNIFNGKHGGVGMITLDEPTFGVFDDPLIDYGTTGRENLRTAWEAIFHKAAAKDIITCLHLHDSKDDLFWDIDSLNLLEAHVEDYLYQSEKTKDKLELTDKFLKASICRTDFDSLLRNNIARQQQVNEITLNEKVAETWKKLYTQSLNPRIFFEELETMNKRLNEIIRKFGIERVPYAGPECGLTSFPSYECALDYLKRMACVVQKHG